MKDIQIIQLYRINVYSNIIHTSTTIKYKYPRILCILINNTNTIKKKEEPISFLVQGLKKREYPNYNIIQNS